MRRCITKNYRVRHKHFNVWGTAYGFYGNGQYVYVEWDNPHTWIAFKIGVWNLIFRVPVR